MTTKKDKDKKTKTSPEKTLQKFQETTDELIKNAKKLKEKFEKVDPDTKKKIIAGVAGAATGLIALAGLIKKKNKK